ncbi:hypothetical protein SLEP1_g6648 [Rubroshorea leprosula]|uniref:YTH domain-containing family protein n=1 Tax=Rubroshorea leprosula TaxID=152421 RepID=A0AAV5I5V0_9ROSI|nr:hypothetical protein SLEP1_g6648 [Rubroshorea leprosula]
MYNPSDHGNAGTYMIHGAEPNLHLTTPLLEQVETMHQEGAPEFIVDQGLYYPTATNYGYYCTGFETPIEWEDHPTIFSTDGPDVQYASAQSERMPYVYYTPSYGYAQSSYNPYNPYIPGAVMTDGPFVGAQQYYTIPSYQNPVTSPAIVPVMIQPDMIPNGSPNTLDFHTSVANRPDGKGLKQNPASALPRNSLKSASDRTNSLIRGDGPSRQSAVRGSVSTGYSPASTYGHQGRSPAGSIQTSNVISGGELLSHSNKLKPELPASTSISNFGFNTRGVVLDKLQPRINAGKALNDANSMPDILSEQNRGPRTNRLKNQLSVKAYTTKAGGSDTEGNIIICTDQFNRDDFPVDYVKAKFFVIKSYSEDDVHKSIKYNVWSSTSHGNKKLEAAYEDVQKIASGKPASCPIFLLFSVNASGQFCGVAEMIGPVDFQKDMNFWQQDKWSGSFPVKWHMIKDVPNSHFRHIILENNEDRPVTNSRDTQEVLYKQGLEMLKIFKNHPFKTSLLDDFAYYENRQKILQEEKARLLIKSLKSPIQVPQMDTANKKHLVGLPSQDQKLVEPGDSVLLKIMATSSADMVSTVCKTADTTVMNKTAEQIAVDAKDDVVSALNIGSLTINSKGEESKPSANAAVVAANALPLEIVTVGSVPIKVNGFAESSSFLRVGTIPLDPGALKLDEGDGSSKSGY